MTLSSTNLILSMPAARIEMSDNTNKFYIGSVLGDGAGDFHIYDYVPLRGVLGYFRSSNTVRLGDSNTTLQVGTKPVALQEWVTQGFLRTSFLLTIALTPTFNDGQTSNTFSSKTDNSGSLFSIGRGIPSLTSNEFGIGHPTAGFASWAFKLDAFGKCSFARDVSVLGMLTVDNRFLVHHNMLQGLVAHESFCGKRCGVNLSFTKVVISVGKNLEAVLQG